MAIVIGDRFPHNSAMYEVLKGQSFQLFVPPMELAQAMPEDPEEAFGFIQGLAENCGPTIDVRGVANGAFLRELQLGKCGDYDYRVMVYIDTTPKTDRIVLTCDWVEHRPEHLHTMEVTRSELVELVQACRDFAEAHGGLNKPEVPVAQSKGPSKKAKAPAKDAKKE